MTSGDRGTVLITGPTGVVGAGLTPDLAARAKPTVRVRA
jgi:hypothetical protein